MQRKTQTTLGELRIGDRFVMPNGNIAFQVTARADKKGRVAYNLVVDGKIINRYDTLKNKATPVVFLRHTIPLPQEECFLEDLNEGDIFCMPDNVILEYVLVQKGKDFYTVRRLDQAAPIKGGRLATVLFIRKKGEVKV